MSSNGNLTTPTSSMTDSPTYTSGDPSDTIDTKLLPSTLNDADTESDGEPSDQPKRVIVNIKDSRDGAGLGMTFSLAFTSTFKNIFDAFKASSCKFCKPGTSMRFKVKEHRVHDEYTPEMLLMKHKQTLSIVAYTNLPAFPCSACQHANYPTTFESEVLDGDEPLLTIVQPSHTKVLRITFNGPNNDNTEMPVINIYQMRGALKTFARSKGYDVNMLRFYYDGERVSVEDTPEEMGMTDESAINVHLEAIGG